MSRPALPLLAALAAVLAVALTQGTSSAAFTSSTSSSMTITAGTWATEPVAPLRVAAPAAGTLLTTNTSLVAAATGGQPAVLARFEYAPAGSSDWKTACEPVQSAKLDCLWQISVVRPVAGQYQIRAVARVNGELVASAPVLVGVAV